MKNLARLATLSVFAMLFVGCGRPQPAPVSQVEEEAPQIVADFPKRASEPEQTESQTYFRYAIPDWCNRLFGAKVDTAGLCQLAEIVHADLDLVAYDQWTEVQQRGVQLSCVLPDMGTDSNGKKYDPFVPGPNNRDHWRRIYDALSEALEKCAAAEPKVENVLVFTGNATEEDRDVQFQNIVDFYLSTQFGPSLIAKAEDLGITFVIEMLNTTGDPETWKGHPGYLGNSTSDVVEKLIRPIGSSRFKLAFDVYHVVMMEEDPIDMIETYHEDIGYVHVAGVMLQEEGHHPQNRGELTISGQVVDYPAVMKKLAEHLPRGTYVLLEYIPQEATVSRVRENLQRAVQLCESGIK